MLKKSFMVVSFLLLLGVGCIGPAELEQFAEISPSQTAFLVPLEGKTKTEQGKFMSVEYLNENKIATKRISLPLRKVDTGRLWYQYKYIPTMAVIAVDRTPVTREWTADTSTGTAKNDQAIHVESKDSIGFGVGINITTMIKEEDAALFLYNFAGRSLAEITDNNVRGTISSVVSRELAKYDLELGRSKKNEVVEMALKEGREFFAKSGVTIANLGLAEGLTYDDPAVQGKINDKFKAEMQIQIEDKTNESQSKINARNIAMAEAQKTAALKFAEASEARKKQVDIEIQQTLAEAQLTMAKNWNGQLPANILPSNSPLLLNLQDK